MGFSSQATGRKLLDKNQIISYYYIDESTGELYFFFFPLRTALTFCVPSKAAPAGKASEKITAKMIIFVFVIFLF